MVAFSEIPCGFTKCSCQSGRCEERDWWVHVIAKNLRRDCLNFVLHLFTWNADHISFLVFWYNDFCKQGLTVFIILLLARKTRIMRRQVQRKGTTKCTCKPYENSSLPLCFLFNLRNNLLWTSVGYCYRCLQLLSWYPYFDLYFYLRLPNELRQGSSTKACREKMRRDKLNERWYQNCCLFHYRLVGFFELVS